MVILQGKTDHEIDSEELKVQHKTINKFVLGEGKNVADDNSNHRGTRMVFLIMNSIDILKELIRLMRITTHLSTDFMKK